MIPLPNGRHDDARDVMRYDPHVFVITPRTIWSMRVAHDVLCEQPHGKVCSCTPFISFQCVGQHAREEDATA